MTTRTIRQDEPVITARAVRMRYGTKDVLHGIDLDVHRGEVLTLLGPNGAGKTTTIEILEGFRRRSAGDVEVLGVDPQHGDDAWRARVGVVFQSWRDHARWRVRELVVQAGLHHRPYTTPERVRPLDADQLLDTVGLREQARSRISTLSGGQRRRLDVALGLVGNPELLFLDEPTTGFDPHARREFHELVHRLSDMEDTTVVLTTHDLAEAERLADRIVILARGRIVASGTPDALARQVGGTAEVRWRRDGTDYVHPTSDPAGFVRQLQAEPGPELTDLEVRRQSLEDTYLALVAEEESAPDLSLAARSEEASR